MGMERAAGPDRERGWGWRERPGREGSGDGDGERGRAGSGGNAGEQRSWLPFLTPGLRAVLQLGAPAAPVPFPCLEQGCSSGCITSCAREMWQ